MDRATSGLPSGVVPCDHTVADAVTVWKTAETLSRFVTFPGTPPSAARSALAAYSRAPLHLKIQAGERFNCLKHLTRCLARDHGQPFESLMHTSQLFVAWKGIINHLSGYLPMHCTLQYIADNRLCPWGTWHPKAATAAACAPTPRFFGFLYSRAQESPRLHKQDASNS